MTATIFCIPPWPHWKAALISVTWAAIWLPMGVGLSVVSCSVRAR